MAKRVLGVGSVSKICKKFAFIASDDYDSVFFPLEADLTAPVKSTDLKKRYKDGDLVVFIAREQPGRTDCPFHALSVAKERDLQKILTAVLDVLPDRALLSTAAGTVLLPADAIDDDGRTWRQLSDGELRGYLRVGEGMVVHALVLDQPEDGCKRVAVRANRTGVRSDWTTGRSAPRPLACPIKTLKTRLCSIPSSSQRELVAGVLGVVICASNDEAFLFAKEVGLAHTLLRRTAACNDSKRLRLSPGTWMVYDVRPQAPTDRLTCIWRADKLRRPAVEPGEVRLWFDGARHKLNAEGTALVCNKSMDGQKCYFWNDRIGRMFSTNNDPHCDFAGLDVRSLTVFSVVRFRAYFGGQYEDCPWNVYHVEVTDLPATTSVLLTREKAKISHLTSNNAGFISLRKQSEVFFAFMDLPDCMFVDLSIGTLVRVTAYQQHRCKTSEMRAILVTPLDPASLSPVHKHPVLDAKFRPMIDWRCTAKSSPFSGRSATSSLQCSSSQEVSTAVDDLEQELELIDFEDELAETPAPDDAVSTALPPCSAAKDYLDQVVDDDQLSLRESELGTPSDESDEEFNLETMNNEIGEINESATRISNELCSSLSDDRLIICESPQSSRACGSAQSDEHNDVVEELHNNREEATEASQVLPVAGDNSWSSVDPDVDLSVERSTSAPRQLTVTRQIHSLATIHRPSAGVLRLNTRWQRSQFAKAGKRKKAPKASSARRVCSPKSPAPEIVERPASGVGEFVSSVNLCPSRPPSRVAPSHLQQHEQQYSDARRYAPPAPVFCFAHAPPQPPPPPVMFVRPPPTFTGYGMPPSLPSPGLSPFAHGPPMSPMSPIYGQHYFAMPPPPMYQLRSLDTAPKSSATTSSGSPIGPRLLQSTASVSVPSYSDDRRLLQRILRDPVIFDLIINRYPDERARCLSILDV